MQNPRCTASELLSQNLHCSKIPGDLHTPRRLRITVLKTIDLSYSLWMFSRFSIAHMKLGSLKNCGYLGLTPAVSDVIVLESGPGTRSIHSSPGVSAQPGLRIAALETRREGSEKASDGRRSLVRGSLIFPIPSHSAYSAIASSFILIRQNSGGAF